MSIALIVAASQNDIIGRDNDLPWYLPTDLKHFKDLTKGKVCIMGRNTYASIFARLGKPLPHRQTIVLSRTASANAPEFQFDTVTLASSIDTALQAAEQLAPQAEHMLCGGAQLYNEFLAQGLVDTIYLTKVMTTIEGDATMHWPTDFPAQWQAKQLNEITENNLTAQMWQYQKTA